MANKPTITHFAATNSSDSQAANSDHVDRSQLAQLYPKPKTYDQRKQDDQRRQALYRRYWPKYPYLNIAAYGSVILGLVIWFVQSLNAWWYSGGEDRGITMSNIFFSFLLGLGLAFLIIAWVRYINKQFSHFGGSMRLFWLVYGSMSTVMLLLWLSGWLWEYTNIVWIVGLSVLHFTIVFFSGRRSMGSTI